MSIEMADPCPSHDEDVMTDTESQCVEHLREWIETASDFYGRTDDRFLLMFVRGCKFNMEKAKQKVRMYYDTRRRLPNWWADRDLRDDNIQSILKHITTFATIDIPQQPCQQPTLVITRTSRLPRHLPNFDSIVKLHGILFEIAVQRPNCQLNGLIWVVDWKDSPNWLITKFLSPMILKNITESFLFSNPVRIKGLYVVNSPLIVHFIWSIAKLFFTQKLQSRVNIYRSDYKALLDSIPTELMPEEYGGHAGPIAQHEEAFLKEVSSFTDYLVDDNKYGFYQ